MQDGSEDDGDGLDAAVLRNICWCASEVGGGCGDKGGCLWCSKY